MNYFLKLFFTALIISKSVLCMETPPSSEKEKRLFSQYEAETETFSTINSKIKFKKPRKGKAVKETKEESPERKIIFHKEIEGEKLLTGQKVCFDIVGIPEDKFIGIELTDQDGKKLQLCKRKIGNHHSLFDSDINWKTRIGWITFHCKGWDGNEAKIKYAHGRNACNSRRPTSAKIKFIFMNNDSKRKYLESPEFIIIKYLSTKIMKGSLSDSEEESQTAPLGNDLFDGLQIPTARDQDDKATEITYHPLGSPTKNSNDLPRTSIGFLLN